MIWVIGCRGMLGSEICRQLSEQNIQYVKSDIDVDITNIDELRKFAKSWNVTWIINCAAYTAVDKAESDVEMATKLNEIGPGNIAKVANELGARIIHISTDYVFDGTGDSPRTEEMEVDPIGVYGVTKEKGEKAVKRNTDKYYILRTAWLYGWAGKNFVYTMIKAMNSHDSVKVVNDQRGTPTFAGDLAMVIIKIIKMVTVPFGIYHVTDLGEITWWDFANEIKNQGIESDLINETGKKCIVNPCFSIEYPTPAKRPSYSVLSKDKIQKALNIDLPQWQDSLRTFLTSPLFDITRIK